MRAVDSLSGCLFLRENRTSFVCSLILVEACANHPMCVRTRNLAYTPPVTNSEHAWHGLGNVQQVLLGW